MHDLTRFKIYDLTRFARQVGTQNESLLEKKRGFCRGTVVLIKKYVKSRYFQNEPTFSEVLGALGSNQ